MLTYVDVIVEHPNIVARHHRIDETNVHVLAPAVCIERASTFRGAICTSPM